MRTVLVSGASGIVGYGILRSLRSGHEPLNLIGTSIHTDSVAPGFCDTFELAPPTDEVTYMAWLLSVIRKHNVTILVPGIEVDVYKWVDHVADIEQAGAVALLNNPDLIRLCGDKWTFFNAVSGAGLKCAIESSIGGSFEDLCCKFGLPFMLKPRRGFASKGIVRVDSRETFERYRDRFGPILMAQPIVGSDDDEFTTAAFCDGLGSFAASMTLRRKLSRDGFTEKAEVVPAGEFAGTLAALCERLRPSGPTNFQFRKVDGGVKLLEINPRISSATSIRAAFGYNESAMAVDYIVNRRLPAQPTLRRGRAVRYTEDFIFYEDGLRL